MTQLVTGNISLKYILEFSMVSVIYAGILGIIVFFSYKYNIEVKNKKIRFFVMIIDILIILLLFIPTGYTKELYLKIFFNTDSYVDFNSYTTNLNFYERNGLINGMYGVFLNNKFTEPDGYDDNKLKQILEIVEVDIKKREEKPNIIVVFSEAFWDIEQADEIQFNKEVTSNFNKLKGEGEFVNLVSPSYGGMSENVAFEFLTGGSMNYFSKGYIPIMSLYSRKESQNIPSLVHVLKNNGYNTEIVFGKDYYNSKKAYTNIGFDKYRELVGKNQYSVSDKYATDDLISRLENKDDKPLFYMLETIESHMPYSSNRYEEYDIEITKSNLSDDINYVIKTYAQGMYNADKELGRLYEYIQNYDEPTVLVFLGDHLPFMYTADNKNAIYEMEYFNTDDPLLNTYRIYNTQALVLSNLEEKIEVPEYLGTDTLFNYIINQFDFEIEDYYKWLYNTSETLSASNRYVSTDKKGNLYTTQNLTSKMKEVYETKKMMQYKFFIKGE